MYDNSINATTEEIYEALLRVGGNIVFTIGSVERGVSLIKGQEERVNNLKIKNLRNFLNQIIFLNGTGAKLEVVKRNKPEQAPVKEQEKGIETIEVTTNSKNRGEIKWKVKVDIGQAFTYPGERIFVVAEITSDKGDRWVQSFYQSSGYNTGSPGMWFPNQGTWSAEFAKMGIEHISKEKYFNSSVESYLDEVNPDQSVSMKVNPQTRLGSEESINANGDIFKEISDKLGNMNIVPTKTVDYLGINTELLRINPNVDIDERSGIEK